MKICTIVGARPQFIKAAVVSRALQQAGGFKTVMIHTGQHYDHNMSEIFFAELGIPQPDYNLGIGGGTHGQNTGRMIEAIEGVLSKEKPDAVIVYGDTDSTLAATLAAVKIHIPIAHVEAGLRSYYRRMPEEINRILTDHASDILFAPTKSALENLSREGIKNERVHFVGDVMYDAALYYGERVERESKILKTLDLKEKSYILATLHREENTRDADRLRSIFTGFSTSLRPVILPLHPGTAKMIKEFGIDIPPAVRMIQPLGYIDMVMLEKKAALIATDSGGVQKEAYFHHVPCLTLRDQTEWVELVEAGANRIVGADAALIGEYLNEETPPSFSRDSLYGQGDSSQLIVRVIQETIKT